MLQDTNNIIHTLQKMRLKKSVSLDVGKKASILNSVFEQPASLVSSPLRPKYTTNIPSPYFVMFSRYVLPVFVLFFVGRVFGDGLVERAQLAIGDFNQVKSEIALQNSLTETKKDIVALKTFALADVSSDKKDLTDKVTSGSRQIRNQVASLVKENKITEAKEIVLTLETALKADELYKVATSVSDEVMETTDLRLELERKETEVSVLEASSSATTTVKGIQDRLTEDKKELSDIESTASTTEMLAEAQKFLLKSEEYVQAGNVENAIISLQAHDRIVAEIKLILLP
ncbi:MAG: hypothetical protein V4686_02675 [Patescibacteria group bacterium]